MGTVNHRGIVPYQNEIAEDQGSHSQVPCFCCFHVYVDLEYRRNASKINNDTEISMLSYHYN